MIIEPINVNTVLEAANNIYAELKLGPSYYMKAPEDRPRIASDQVKAILHALVQELNKR